MLWGHFMAGSSVVKRAIVYKATAMPEPELGCTIISEDLKNQVFTETGFDNVRKRHFGSHAQVDCTGASHLGNPGQLNGPKKHAGLLFQEAGAI